MSDDATRIEAHYARIWGPAARSIRLEVGRIDELPADFRVLVTNLPTGVTTYATVCMSEADDQERVELHLRSRAPKEEERGLAELLHAVAHYHRTGAAIGLGHTVNFGRPWLPGSACSYALVSLPYADGPRLEWAPGRSIRCLWLLPITEAERQLKIARGVLTLETRFEATQVDLLDPLRPSVI